MFVMTDVSDCPSCACVSAEKQDTIVLHVHVLTRTVHGCRSEGLWFSEIDMTSKVLSSSRAWTRLSSTRSSSVSSNERRHRLRRQLQAKGEIRADTPELRQEFEALEASLAEHLDLHRLDRDQQDIHFRHDEAVKDFNLFYTDPVSGLRVMTRWRHFLRGFCCGSACRHCVYDHEKVSAEKLKIRSFNSSFWENKKN